jgi:ATP-dependent helicase/DNAse subunit B
MDKTDKFKAVWLSHSSIADFLNCPRKYFLRAIYRDPINNHKITQVTPALSRGQVIHSVLESLSTLPAAERFEVPLTKKLEMEWVKISGKVGGFRSSEEESRYKEESMDMIKKVMDNPGPLAQKAIKIKEPLPHYWLSEEEGLILSGKIDWLIYDEDTDGVKILDFKTGKNEEDESSLQLPIYHLIVKNTQSREVTGAYYWYLYHDTEPREASLTNPESTKEEVLSIGRRIKLARQLGHFVCPNGSAGCKHCAPLEAIKNGRGEKVGVSEYKQDLYVLN